MRKTSSFISWGVAYNVEQAQGADEQRGWVRGLRNIPRGRPSAVRCWSGSNVTASLWFSEPCLLPYFWTVNLLQDLSDLYCIFWIHSSQGNYSPLTSAVICWSGSWAICSGKVICDNIASPLKSFLKHIIDHLLFRHISIWRKYNLVTRTNIVFL